MNMPTKRAIASPPEGAQRVIDECIAEAWRTAENNDEPTEEDFAADIVRRLAEVFTVSHSVTPPPDDWCGYSAPFLGRCSCGDPANHEPGGRFYKEGRLPDSDPPLTVCRFPEGQHPHSPHYHVCRRADEEEFGGSFHRNPDLHYRQAFASPRYIESGTGHHHEAWQILGGGDDPHWCGACGERVTGERLNPAGASADEEPLP